MKTTLLSQSRLPAGFLRIITDEFADSVRVAQLFADFLGHESYSRDLAIQLIEVASGQAGDGWEIRRLATLMLEHQALKIADTAAMNALKEWDLLLTRLGLKAAPGLRTALHESVLKEGFTSTRLRAFVPQLRRKLMRLATLHERLDGKDGKDGKNKKAEALRAFVIASRRDCRLSLARYLFTPEEVVARILEAVRLSKGLPDLDPFQAAHIDEEIAHTIAGLPDFEAAILQGLRRKAGIYWVSDATPAEINSLVEYPLTTVALAIKPPGSCYEFEIKRVGRRGRKPLGVVFRRHGRMVPPPHRFDGGIRQRMVRWEAEMGTKFARLYRLAHRAEAPVSKIVSRFSVYNVPINGAGASGVTEARLLNYFTDARLFGNGYTKMRAAMQKSVDAFNIEEQFIPLDLPGDMGLTIRFLMHITPMQVIISGSSSFRLDRLALYLSEKGPEAYFKEGLRRAYAKSDARSLADEILEEVLCVYRPPDVKYRGHRQYVKAAFEVAENRERADRNYLSVMGDFGAVRGTLLALRGHSHGESFVGRNAGLRSVWEDGEWRIRILFMDHDNLNVASQSFRDYQALGTLSGMDADEVFSWGTWSDGSYISGAVDYLKQIYRVGDELADQGKGRFDEAMAAAYRRMQQEMAANPELQRFFDRTFVDRLRDWDQIAAEYLKARHDEEAVATWRDESVARLVKKGYAEKVVWEHLSAVEAHGHFLERYAFLFT